MTNRRSRPRLPAPPNLNEGDRSRATKTRHLRPLQTASPWQNGVVEPLIGLIRLECVDHIIVLGQVHLRQIPQSYARYYNDIRTHRSLDKDAAVSRPIQRTGIINSHAILGGLSSSLRPRLGFRYTQRTQGRFRTLENQAQAFVTQSHAHTSP
jgi:hypothetical protein